MEISTCKVCTSSLISSPEPQNSAISMANTNFKGRYLHEGVSNLRSSKELTCQFVSVLSNGEGLSAIWASLNFWLHYYEISCSHVHMMYSMWRVDSKNIKGYTVCRIFRQFNFI